MPVETSTSRVIPSPARTVWSVIDDFPNIADWTTGVLQSVGTTIDQSTGIGAERTCDLGGTKRLYERISAYIPGESMTVQIVRAEGLPIRESKATFAVRPIGEDHAEVTVEMSISPKMPDLLVRLFRPAIARKAATDFSRVLEELEIEVARRSTL